MTLPSNTPQYLIEPPQVKCTVWRIMKVRHCKPSSLICNSLTYTFRKPASFLAGLPPDGS